MDVICNLLRTGRDADVRTWHGRHLKFVFQCESRYAGALQGQNLPHLTLSRRAGVSLFRVVISSLSHWERARVRAPVTISNDSSEHWDSATLSTPLPQVPRLRRKTLVVTLPYRSPFSLSAASTFSGVTGRSLILTPTASYTAFTMAGAEGTQAGSPMPFAPKGPDGS
jgi:hypothetical protein